MSRDDGGSAADKARELERIQRQAQVDGRVGGGLSEEDLRNLERSARQEDFDRLNEEEEFRRVEEQEEFIRSQEEEENLRSQEQEEYLRQLREEAAGESVLDDIDTAPEAPTGSILDDIDTAHDALGVMGLAPDPKPELTGGMLDALKRPENMARLIGAGLGIIGMLLLSYGLRAEAGGAPAGAVPSATPTAAATGSPVAQASPSATAATAANRPPEAGALQAVQVETSTIYTVQGVRDPDGDALRYAWTTTNPCGTLTGAATPTFTWAHPHTTTPGSCPAEPFHPAAITVQIDDGRFIVTRQYIRGSAEGLGAVPLAGIGIATIAPSPAALPTTTSRPATATPMPSASPTTATGGGPNLPLALLGGLLALGGLGLALGGPRIFGGPRIRREQPEDPCEKEKQDEAEARARREAARKRLDRINGLRAAHDRAQAELQRAQREEAASKDDRTTSWGQVDGGERIYTNKDQRARIERAEAAARAAREAADASRSAYEGAGNGGEATAAQDELADADRLWERANAALARCLRLNAPPPPPPPQTA